MKIGLLLGLEKIEWWNGHVCRDGTYLKIASKCSTRCDRISDNDNL